MNRFILILGSNLAEKQANLAKARAEISAQIGEIDCVSSIYQTAPWGNTEQDDFVNQVVSGLTPNNASDVMQKILMIEAGMGRVRESRWEPRIIDIDILFFNNYVIDLPGLHIPHPRIAERRFVLQPLAEIFPELVHPVLGKSIKQLLGEVMDDLQVIKMEST